MGTKLTNSNKAPWPRLKRHFTESFTGDLLSSKRAQSEDRVHVDEERDKRRRNAHRYIFLLLAVIILPLLVNNFYQGQYLLATGALLLLGLLVLDIVLSTLHRETILTPAVVVGVCMGLAVLSLYYGQLYSLFLMFPMLVALPVLFTTRWAIILGVLSAVGAAPVVFSEFKFATGFVLGVSMTLTWLVSAWLEYAMTKQSRRLKDMAITDSLTGAFNRRYLELQASRALQDWERNRRSVSLLLLDIDHFKKINDEFGHHVGDEALKSLVSLIKERIRGVDTLCRYGGEEFVLLLSDTRASQAKIVANQLRRAVQQAQLLPQGPLTVSVGVCDLREVPDLENWLRYADAALYAAKDGGRNRVELAESASILIPEVPPAPRTASLGRH
ncbi:putative diguanylate cyclase DgcC [Halioglobus japonicus]|nr:putative diguanylate cyclase DgcC [Halioglobus japonicus]